MTDSADTSCGHSAAATPHASSFRDPSGYITHHNGEFLRVIAPAYREHYEQLQNSGLQKRLTSAGLLLPHTASDVRIDGAFKVVRPRQLGFISHPYEWCFEQWRDAAEATLRIEEEAIASGMTLKDASAFNIQFVDGRAVLIDLLSFERLEAKPWVAYAQFCRHFLAPLALMSYCDGRMGQMLRTHLDGIPLDLASRLLPSKTRLKPALLLHLHLHAASSRLKAKGKGAAAGRTFSTQSLLGLVQTLRSAVASLKYTPRRDVWANYYSETVTGGGYVGGKQRTVEAWIAETKPRRVWDLGANTGLFSRIASKHGAETIAFDGDIDCVELNWRELKKNPEPRLLPLFTDLTNPAPGLGWAHEERSSWMGRANADLVLALALIHHLAIGNNVPLPNLAMFFARFSPRLIIEFVPKHDPNAQKLLDVRRDIFSGYTKEGFERAFAQWFTIERQEQMPDSQRVLYFLRRERCPAA